MCIFNEKQEKQSENFFDKANNVELDVKDKMPLLEWLVRRRSPPVPSAVCALRALSRVLCGELIGCVVVCMI